MLVVLLTSFVILVVEQTPRKPTDGMVLIVVQVQIDLDVRKLISQIYLEFAHRELAMIDHISHNVRCEITRFAFSVHASLTHKEERVLVMIRLTAD